MLSHLKQGGELEPWGPDDGNFPLENRSFLSKAVMVRLSGLRGRCDADLTSTAQATIAPSV